MEGSEHAADGDEEHPTKKTRFHDEFNTINSDVATLQKKVDDFQQVRLPPRSPPLVCKLAGCACATRVAP